MRGYWTSYCANKECRESLYKKMHVNRGDPEMVKVSTWLCPACWYLTRRVFGGAVAVTGVVCGVAWWVVNHFIR